MNEKLHIARHTLTVLTVLLCWSCASDDATTDRRPVAPQADTPLAFDVAEVVESQTRTGAAGSIDYSVLSKSTYGFGVVAGTPLDWTNQQVKYDPDAGTTNPGSAFFYPSKWSYNGGVKYWTENLSGGPVDFYAYAPYVASPSGTDGITAISGTDITYAINTTAGAGVDLLWGVNGKTGLPWKKTTYTSTGDGKQPTGGPVLFTFRHALSAIGFRVQSMIGKNNDLSDLDDESTIAGVLRSGGNYKVTIKKIELSGNFHPSGVLSLDNSTEDTPNTPNWSSKATATSQTLTISSDPDGNDNNSDSEIVAAMKHPHAKTATTSSEAETIMTDATNNGVSQEANQQVVVNDGNGREAYFLVIPSEASNYTLTLHWCVSAVLPNGTYAAEDHVNSINITDLKLIAGTKYLFNFVINLKLIGLEVTATDWRETSETTSVVIEHGTSASESLVREFRSRKK